MWGESKLAQMLCSGIFAPRFVNNDYVRAEIIYSTLQAHHMVYVTAEITYSTVHACQAGAALCSMPVRASPRMPRLLQLGQQWSGIMVMLYEIVLWLCYCYIMVMLWLLL